jgi:hypothetical protein
VPPHSLRTVCRSLWQTPQYNISISTSCGLGVLRLMVHGAKGLAAFCAAYDRVDGI